MIVALCSSRANGTKDFRINGVNFGWETMVNVYESDLYRAQQLDETKRAPSQDYVGTCIWMYDTTHIK